MKKLIIYFLFQIFLSVKSFAQSTYQLLDSVPKQYIDQFKVDRERYWQYVIAAADSTQKAFSLWQKAINDNRKGYNLDSLNLVFNSLQQKEYLRTVEFTKQNPDSYFSLYNFKDYLIPRIDSDSSLSIYSFFTKELRATPLGHSVYEKIKRKQSLILKAEMPVFSFITDNGEKINLSSFRSRKHVLICFWASWCKPCVKNIPFLKEIEEEYKGKGLQLLSVSLDIDSIRWLEAVNKYAMPWLQTCDLPSYTTDGSVRLLYEINFVPQYFLIDKEGKLIYHDVLSKDNEEYSVLKQVLQKVFN